MKKLTLPLILILLIATLAAAFLFPAFAETKGSLVTVAYRDASGTLYLPEDAPDGAELTAITVEAPVTNEDITLKLVPGSIAARFTATLPKATYNTLRSLGKVEMGMLITPKQYVEKAGAFTMEALQALNPSTNNYVKVEATSFYAQSADTYTLAGSLTNFSETTYAKNPEFAAIAYLTVTVNGESFTVYGDYAPEHAQDIRTFAKGVNTNDLGATEMSWLSAVLNEFTLAANPALKLPDFLVHVDEGKDPIVLQLTDPQIVDSTQQRTADRLGDTLYNLWLPEKIDELCYDYIRETVTRTSPDLILITGDVIYGEFDDAGTALLDFIEFMESFDIPWAPILGNHDAESAKGVAWICAQYEAAENCLFKRNTLTGNGNYTVGIAQGDELLRVFYMMDSNGCGKPSDQSVADGQIKTDAGFGDDQVVWYENSMNAIKALSPDTNFSMAYHIQQHAFYWAMETYGYGTVSVPINVDTHPDQRASDFGMIGRNMKSPWDGNHVNYKKFVALGVDSIFVGHEHCNSASIVYNGIRFQYGQKSSLYDRANYVDKYGNVSGAYSAEGGQTPLVGGTVIPLAAGTGEIKNPYIYLCDEAGGDIDWDNLPEPPVTPDGLGFESFSMESALSVEMMTFEGKNTYQFTASAQGKIKFNKSIIDPTKSLTFSVYIPAGSPTVAITGRPYLGIRWKIGSTSEGYISLTDLKTDTWQTVTVSLADYEGASEFSLIIPKGSVVYITDIAVATPASGDEGGVKPIGGMDLSTLSKESGISVSTATVAGQEAYAVSASAQGKLKLPAATVKTGNTLTFKLYIASGAPTLQLPGYPQLAIRNKNGGSGYILFGTAVAAGEESYVIALDTWQTLTIDVSAYTAGAEFAFLIPTGGTVYLTDLVIS